MKKSGTQELLTTKIIHEIDQCIQCNHCIDVCPVTKKDFSIEELNKAILSESAVSDAIKNFTFSCVQCGWCVPVCPQKLHRNEMILILRHKLRQQKPYGYKRYLAIRGPKLSTIAQTAQGLFVAMKSKQTPDLARYMEKPPTTSTSVLFYPGCYLYSFETIRQTKRLLDHVGEPYTILGGLTTCCGLPQYLQGEFELADTYMSILHDKIKKINPLIVVTGCAECFESLLKIKESYHETFEVLSIVDYLMRHREKFPKVHLRTTVTLHDACRRSRTIDQKQ